MSIKATRNLDQNQLGAAKLYLEGNLKNTKLTAKQLSEIGFIAHTYYTTDELLCDQIFDTDHPNIDYPPLTHQEYLTSQQQLANTSIQERAALINWTQDYYDPVTRILNGNDDNKDFISPQAFLAYTKLLDQALNHTQNTPRIVYRGVNGHYMRHYGCDINSTTPLSEQIKNKFRPGTTIEFKSYHSTTYSPQIAIDAFAHNGGAIFEIYTTKGANVVSISSFDEKEVIMPRAQHYTVVNVHPLDNNTTIIQLIATTPDGQICDKNTTNTQQNKNNPTYPHALKLAQKNAKHKGNINYKTTTMPTLQQATQLLQQTTKDNHKRITQQTTTQKTNKK